METIINVMIAVHLEDSQEGKSTEKVHTLQYQEDLNLLRLEIQIALEIQTQFIRTNAVPALHHISKP